MLVTETTAREAASPGPRLVSGQAHEISPWFSDSSSLASLINPDSYTGS